MNDPSSSATANATTMATTVAAPASASAVLVMVAVDREKLKKTRRQNNYLKKICGFKMVVFQINAI